MTGSHSRVIIFFLIPGIGGLFHALLIFGWPWFFIVNVMATK